MEKKVPLGKYKHSESHKIQAVILAKIAHEILEII